MKDCAYFLATSEGEWFGLPALEGHGRGRGGRLGPGAHRPHYLDHGRNGVVLMRLTCLRRWPPSAPTPSACCAIASLLGGMATASRYSLGHQRSLVDGAMGRGLREALSWS